MQDNQLKKRNKKVDQALDYQATFATAEGERVLYDLMKTHYVMGTTFTADQNVMALKEGERNVVLRILHLLKIDVEMLHKKYSEGLKQETTY